MQTPARELNSYIRKDAFRFVPSLEDEIVDVYDENLNRTGKVKRRVAHRDGLLHRTFQCWFADSENIYFQIRGDDVGFPGLLDATVGGHVRAGETLQQYSREIPEEVGLSVHASDLRYIGRNRFEYSGHGFMIREFSEVYVFTSEGGLDIFRPNPEELSGIAAVPFQVAGPVLSEGCRSEVECILSKAGKLEHCRMAIESSSFIPGMQDYFAEAAVVAEACVSGEGSTYLHDH